ncbi:PQQ-binding-like beta-propeller repeat protein [Candidatus Acetothermia bacterium]|nr:PQQ-binding-like beta-propeller repeat protein [Candidatus Acetothermia bacterium]MBI3643607.1 PQQ-binding-like beta-propeller repeat protein [Candidatus Acetothermia bacterium]
MRFLRAFLLAVVAGVLILCVQSTEGQISFNQSLFCKVNLGSPIESSPAGGSWPVFHHDQSHSGLADGMPDSVYIGTNDLSLFAINMQTCSIAWKFGTGGAVKSSPVVSVDSSGAVQDIYVGSDDGKLYAVKPDGKEDWQFAPTLSDGNASPGAIRSAPTIMPLGADNGVLFSSDDTHVYLLLNKQQLHIFPVDTSSESIPRIYTGSMRGSPIFDSDHTQVYVSSFNQTFHALGSTDLVRNWDFPLNAPSSSSPALGEDKTIYLVSDVGTLYSIRSDGAQQWRLFLNGDVTGSPSISSSGIIYLGTESGVMFGVKPNGTILCSFQTLGPDGRANSGDESFGGIRSTPAIANGFVYFGANDGTLYVIEENTCKLRTSFITKGPIVSSPMITVQDGRTRVLFGSEDGYFYALSLNL